MDIYVLTKRMSILILSYIALLTLGLTIPAQSFAQTASDETLSLLKTRVIIDSNTVEPSYGTVAGSWFYHSGPQGSQVLLLGFPRCGFEQKPDYRVYVDLTPNSEVKILLPPLSGNLSCRARSLGKFHPSISWNGFHSSPTSFELSPEFQSISTSQELSLTLSAPNYDIFNEFENQSLCVVELLDFQIESDGKTEPFSLDPERKPQALETIEVSPDFSPALEKAMVSWDWRLQDGYKVPNESRSYSEILTQRFKEGRALLDELQKDIETETYESIATYDEDVAEKFNLFRKKLEGYKKTWDELEQRFGDIKEKSSDSDDMLETLWENMHETKREILTNVPYFQFGSLLFVKNAPGVMSHQLTQVYGYCARPGGGVFCLEAPGKSMKTRNITPPNLPLGSYMTPELSFDGDVLYFAFCATPTSPTLWRDPETMSRRFHIYKTRLNSNNVEDAIQLTDGDYDDFSPLLMPDGDLVFCSTRRGGFHRCGAGPCYVYTLARSKGDGSDPHPISFHETNEWFPTLAHNGRIIYTRWDYVDRDAVYYQQLWSARQDGADVRIVYGNNTFNPPGMWEPKAVPGSEKIMAVAGPHHGLSAGSVVLIDPNKDVDGDAPIERLTPDVRFPEGEAPLPQIPMLPTLCDFDYAPTSFWQATRPANRPDATQEEKRWAVHCFKSPIPLTEKFFIASYSFDKLLGEAGPNIPNQFGIYYCDSFGNRELIYRDPNISSLWAIPVRPRPIPPVVTTQFDENQRNTKKPTGVFFIQNIYESWPTSIPDKVKSLRVVQVLPKTTPNANDPMVGAANASPGKQALGTVPVEEDGSAFFEAPAKVPLLFQALDENGQMIQGMRSDVYLQPGEAAGCVGCHENRMESVPSVKTIASTRAPSKILPGPDGSAPLSYPILVQPLLDKNCLACHNTETPEGNVNLEGVPEGHYTRSYNSLINYVTNTYWGAPNGNYEPRTEPLRFGAVASKLTRLLREGHHDVKLTDEDWERLNVWIDVNALFYGTFNVQDQERQQRGERIEGPELE